MVAVIDREHVGWLSPAPTWGQSGDPRSDKAQNRLLRPSILRFASDEFMDEFNAEVGRVYQQEAWEERPDLKVYRYGARLDPDHDFGSIGAAFLGMEPAPRARLEAADVPVAVINGGNDDGDGNAAKVAAMIPGARSVVAGDGDHMTACYDDAFHAAVISFLRDQWSV